jgi:hypothetical protein
VAIPISRRDWADLTNTTVETICRTLGYLADKDMLRAEAGGRYRIRDLAVLCRLAGMDPDLDCGRLAAAHAPAAPGAVSGAVLRQA